MLTIMNQEILTEQQAGLIYKIPLFRDMSDEFKGNLLDRLDYSVYRIKRGEVIIKQDTPCQHLHILLEGKLEVNIIDGAGNNIKVENIVAPRAFATPHLFNSNDIFPATFTVMESGILFRATKESAFELISSNPDLLKTFLRIRGNCTACTVSRLRILSYKSIRSRFICYLFEHKVNSTMSVMQHNQTQLAEYLNVSRPALAKEAKLMTDEGLIDIKGKDVHLLNTLKLLKYI